MRHWWVNQNQTSRQEIDGGYLWSPKRKSNGQRNPFYEFMREVAPGDVIFCFCNTYIGHIGIAQSTAFESPKPPEFGAVGPSWSLIGWKIICRFFRLANPLRPADHMDVLSPALPQLYSPLQENGRGNQGVYLTELTDRFVAALISLIGTEARDIIKANRVADSSLDVLPEAAAELANWEDHIADSIATDRTLSDTQRFSLIQARRGQGEFRRNVQQLERHCRITRVDNPDHLIASHTKPWRDCTSADERLDGENGLLLTPSIDHLFDRGFISFEDNGDLLVSPVADQTSLIRMGVPHSKQTNVGNFSQGQRHYLEFHRESIFLAAVRR